MASEISSANTRENGIEKNTKRMMIDFNYFIMWLRD